MWLKINHMSAYNFGTSVG